MKDFDKLYDELINKNISKDEFISKLKDLRAFKREDRLKLQIIDASPFTIWACGIDNKIRLWEHRCQELYGYSHEEAINKSFIELFVAPDERIRAELDCADIIQNNRYIINLAGDINKYNNLIFLMTNCFKVTDTDSGEDLQAELGLVISNPDWERLNREYEQIIETNRKLEKKRDKYIIEFNEFYEHSIYRIHELNKDIRSGEVQAVKQDSHDAYMQGVNDIKTNLEACQQNLENIISSYSSNIHAAKTEKELEIHIREFRKNSIDISDKIESYASLLLQLQIKIAHTSSRPNKNIAKTEVVMKKDSLLDILVSKKADLLNKIEKKINDYESDLLKPGIKDSSELAPKLKQRCQQFENMKDNIIKYFGTEVSFIKNCENIADIESEERNILNKINEYFELIKSSN